jgi:uncharacterized protein (DUF1800 family)
MMLDARRSPLRLPLSVLAVVVVVGGVLMERSPAAAQSASGTTDPHPGVYYANFPPDALRLADQATFGPTPALVEHILAVGTDAFLAEQLAADLAPYPDLPAMPSSAPPTCTGTCQRDNYTMYPLQQHFFSNALYGGDQLRQRVAFALGQILVTSGVDIRLSSWMGPYQQILYADAFGSFRQLLSDVTLNAAMGSYLNMANNKKLNTKTGAKPNENYAREVLQLFSIGLVKLNPNGTSQLDPNGQPIPTYDQTTVDEFARVFTGWTLAPAFGTGVPNYRDPMVVRVVTGVEVDHDTGGKHLLNGQVVASGLPAAADLQVALSNIASHPNVGPFIGKQLIQHLVTSNPSPDYVARISTVFAGTGGNLGAVVTAILEDPEARGPSHPEPTYGHLLSPAVFIVRVLRAFGATSDGVLASFSTSMGQDIFRPASVFSFYPPGYRIVGSGGLLGPEFKLDDSASALARTNFVNTVVFGSIAPSPPDRPTGTVVDLTHFVGLAAYPSLLVNELNALLLHRSMSAAMHDAIVTAVTVVPATNALMRARTAAYLVASSSQYQVER